MIPGLLASEIAAALKQFIVTGFETETPPFAGEFERLIEHQGQGDAFIKGPFISVDLPFVQGSDTTQWFRKFKTKFAPFAHQEQAWNRLSSDRLAANTLVATGTGSGKTECFMYPVLDHCARHPGPGIKAIIIYPMNALATDQAKRFAATIASQAGLKDVRVGLFVGQSEKASYKVMTDTQVISCKDTMRQNPPDILLTNYKMLDYLLMRPKDWHLWQENGPDALRYLIVDEMHTFDGAQGTDLALLIRRLKARLGTPAGSLVCVGTSATLGDGSQSSELTDYATDVFDSKFDATSIVSEQRQKPAQFLSAPKYFQMNHRISAQDILTAQKQGLTELLNISWSLFFGDQPEMALDTDPGRIFLGQRLRSLSILSKFFLSFSGENAKVLSVAEAGDQLKKYISINLLPHPDAVIYALLALLAHARDPNGAPLVQLRVQLWVRELRRITAKLRNADPEASTSFVGEANSEPLLSFADDELPDNEQVRLPILQCRECHGTAWLARLGNNVDGVKVDKDLNKIYSAYFSQLDEMAILVPAGFGNRAVPSLPMHICSECGIAHVGHNSQDCAACGAVVSLQVKLARFQSLFQSKRGQAFITRQHRNCPYCLAQESLLIFGSRAASLSAVAIHQLYASRDNDDKKLIAFSDSVQDASHRAGFFAARTWHNNIRMGLVQCLDGGFEPPERLPLVQFAEYFEDYWLGQGDFSPERYLTEFMPPDKRYRHDFEQFERTGQVNNSGLLKVLIAERALWQLLEDTAWRCAVGRSLNRTGNLVLAADLPELAEAGDAWGRRMREQFGFEFGPAGAPRFLAGLVQHLLFNGAIDLPLFTAYLASGLRTYKAPFPASIPVIGPNSPRPIFPGQKSKEGFEVVLAAVGAGSWYQRWLKVNGVDDVLVDTKQIDDVLLSGFEQLVGLGIFTTGESTLGTVFWALNKDRVYISTELKALKTNGSRSVHVSTAMAEMLTGGPSLTATDATDIYGPAMDIQKSLYWELYRTGTIARVIAHEHTGLLSRDDRVAVEESFINGKKPRKLNLLSATPTLEMGIDIGDLSSVLLCSVPPAQTNYLQRVGRGGRRDGNSFVMTVANGRAHDLVFYHDPKKMMAGVVKPPAVFLRARHVLRRQLLAYGMDCWTHAIGAGDYIPAAMQPVLDAVERHDMSRFPYSLLGYIDTHMQQIWEGFSALVATALNEQELIELQNFLFGGGLDDVDPLKSYVNTRVMTVVEDRKRLTENIETLKKEIAKMLKLPADEHRELQLVELNQELVGYKRLRLVINKKETLNFFTDEGLLPNYAFPEEGTTLHSVIYRGGRVSDSSSEPTLEKFEFEYQRPAQSALSELAPDSTFYAGNKKVTVTRVETAKGSAIAEWRFCSRCNYSVELGDVSGNYFAPTCPRCSSAMWSDESAKANMLKMTQVYAHSSMKDALLDDNSDDREPIFFNRQMLIDFDPKEVKSTWVLKDDTRPFGFEFVQKASFLEVNFGKRDQGDIQLEVAGQSMIRAGFKICRLCGMVQSKTKKANQRPHLRSCKYYSASEDEQQKGLVNCLYLYRQFNSEAIRILLPRLVTGGTEEQVSSFVAALQLGLKGHFGGKVDHLRVGYQSEPVGGTDNRRHFLVLYDSVPGGTGYLQELLTDITQFENVFRRAYEIMLMCSCNEGRTDGCYGCLHEYRNSRSMTLTKKSVATEMLKPLVAPDLEWELTKQTLSDIGDDPWVDSELEKQFPEAIAVYSGSEVIDGVRLKVNKDIVFGKNGHRLIVGSRQWSMEPHVQLGPKDGVQVHCEPDFVIRPEHFEHAPIAVFLDGYEFHKGIVHDDLLKRQSLMQAGYRVWSLSWYDVAAVFGSHGVELPHLNSIRSLTGNANAIQSIAEKTRSEQWQAELAFTGFDRLMRLLAGTGLEVPDVAWLTCLALFDQQRLVKPGQVEVVQQFVRPLPTSFADLWPVDCVINVTGVVEHQPQFSMALGLVREDFISAHPTSACFAIRYQENNTGDVAERKTWQLFWQMINLFQFLPNFVATTGKADNLGFLSQLQFYPPEGEDKHSGVRGSTQPGAPDWIDYASSDIQDQLKNCPALWDWDIEVGFELDSESGEVLAEAELAVVSNLICMLIHSQPEQSQLWQMAGWQVTLSVDEFNQAVSATGE